jgi:hypothetical protein
VNTAQWYAERVRNVAKIGAKDEKRKPLLIVVPFFNEVETVLKNLDYLQKQTFKNFDVALCYSVEGEKFFDARKLKRELEKRKYGFTIYMLKAEFESGFPTGFFSGEVFAIKHNYEALIYSDSDAFAVNENLVRILFEEYKKENKVIFPFFTYINGTEKIGSGLNPHNFLLMPVNILEKVGLHYLPMMHGDDINYTRRIVNEAKNRIKYIGEDLVLSIHPYKIETTITPKLSLYFHVAKHTALSKQELFFQIIFISFTHFIIFLFDKNQMKYKAFFEDIKELISEIVYNEKITLKKIRENMFSYIKNYKTVEKKDFEKINKENIFLVENGASMLMWREQRIKIEYAKRVLQEILKVTGSMKKVFRKICVRDRKNLLEDLLCFILGKQYWIKKGDKYILIADNTNPVVHAIKIIVLVLIYPLFLILYVVVTIVAKAKYVDTRNYGTDIDYSRVKC